MQALPHTMKGKGFEDPWFKLCNEIHLPTSDERTAVCCLSSVNLEKFDEWKDTTMVRDLIRFLDNVLQFFIDNAGDEISRARYSATQERSLGLGAMGWHSLLHQKRILLIHQRRELNREVFKYIKDEASKESNTMGYERGEIQICKVQVDVMHTYLQSPLTQTVLLLFLLHHQSNHQSKRIHTQNSCGSHLVKNKYLEEELKKVKKNTQDVWSSIITIWISPTPRLPIRRNEMSLRRRLKSIRWCWWNSADRQEYLCQGQSLNLFFPPVQRSQTYIEPTLPHGSWEQKVCTISELKHLNVQRMLQRKFKRCTEGF